MSRNRKDVEKIKITTRQQVKGGTWSYMFHFYDDCLERRTAQQGGFKTKEEAYEAGKVARKALSRTQDRNATKYTLNEFVEHIWKPYTVLIIRIIGTLGNMHHNLKTVLLKASTAETDEMVVMIPKESKWV